jgi:catechol 2,3-dioxygenase-like lactoylglutathione lyase family enzyme
VGLDHLVMNTRDVEQAVTFYGDVLGMEILRLDEFREGKVGFVSARVSPDQT